MKLYQSKAKFLHKTIIPKGKFDILKAKKITSSLELGFVKVRIDFEGKNQLELAKNYFLV